MKYSYITPRKKSMYTPEMQLMSIFFGITIFMLLLTYIFLLFKDYSFTQDQISVLEQIELTNTEIDTIENHIVFVTKQSELAERIYTNNTVLKDSMSNMFDLVPKRITLSEAKLLEHGLILYGITPNKDVYNFMLQAPLRSIFHRTYSSFYPAQNGWLRFVSTNYVDIEEPLIILEEDEKPEESEEDEDEDYEN